jgi:hypothetical protein
MRGSVPQPAAVVDVVLTAAVGEQFASWAAWAPALAQDRRDAADQGDELGDVLVVVAGQADRERDVTGVVNQVVLGAGAAALDRREADVVPSEDSHV